MLVCSYDVDQRTWILHVRVHPQGRYRWQKSSFEIRRWRETFGWGIKP
jgi:hypothetical protein